MASSNKSKDWDRVVENSEATADTWWSRASYGRNHLFQCTTAPAYVTELRIQQSNPEFYHLYEPNTIAENDAVRNSTWLEIELVGEMAIAHLCDFLTAILDQCGSTLEGLLLRFKLISPSTYNRRNAQIHTMSAKFKTMTALRVFAVDVFVSDDNLDNFWYNEFLGALPATVQAPISAW